MRLFGNIFGGEVALGVITALTIAIIPAAMLLLEGLLNFVQALIFSTLMLMYTIIAVETHDDHEEHPTGPGGRHRPTGPGRVAGPLTPVNHPSTRHQRNGGASNMEFGPIGAGLAALGVIGPGIGIGILTGLAATAIGRNPDADAADPRPVHPRRGVRRRPRRPRDRRRDPRPRPLGPGEERIVDLLAIASGVAQGAFALAQEEGERESGLQINFFWVIVSSLNFIVFAVILYWLFGGPLTRLLAERRARVEQGQRDAEQARRDRESAETERLAAIQEARREANEILTRAQKVAQDARDADIAATKAELERLRERATAEIDAEKQRAITELRGEVADLALAAASRVVRETISTDRERRLVEEFLAETGAPGSGSGGSAGDASS